jgi:BirA family transcriptional regulator, biotin operon repressor / biotin---[acetyl-CoA-carboxylase] ligase
VTGGFDDLEDVYARTMSPSPYADLSRPPLSERALRRALVVDGGVWTDLRYTFQTGSTNADAATAARTGAPEGLIVVTDEQTAGKGRLDRQWTSPPAAGIAVSVLLRPGRAVEARGWSPIPMSRYALLPLLAGVALAESVRRLGDVDGVLKWPNDLLIDDRKCAGVLAETVTGTGGEPPAVVVGIGLNVTLRESELPRPDATSLQLSGSSCVDRDPLLRALLRSFADRYAAWRDAAGDPVASGLIELYRFHCATIGRTVRVELPGGAQVAGVVDSVDDDGCLVVGGRSIAAGDVVHVR